MADETPTQIVINGDGQLFEFLMALIREETRRRRGDTGRRPGRQ